SHSPRRLVGQQPRATPQCPLAFEGMVPGMDAQNRHLFPALLRGGLKGRSRELATLERIVLATAPTRLALVGAGGSGKSVMAAALAHRIARHFPGGIHWFRVGAWDFRTLTEMMALRFGTTRDRHRIVPALRARLGSRGSCLLVLDNHEDDAAMS